MPNSWQDDPQGYLQDVIGSPVTITSGYRSPQHNAAVGGVPNSAHLNAQAFDFVPKGMSMSNAAAKLAKSGIPFDQLINEGDHVHVSFAPANRRQVLGNVPQQSISDDDLFKALTSAPSAQPSAPAQSGLQYPPGDSRNGPAAVTVSRPKSLSDDQIFAALTKGAPASQAQAVPSPVPSQQATGGGPSQQGPSTLGDMLRTLPGSLVKGASSLAGVPGDVNALLDAAGNAITGANISTRTLPTSEQIGNAVAAPVGGFYQPQTTAGKYTDTIGQFLPAALAPGNMLLRAARVVAPGAASEAAGQATEGSPMEPFARVLGALAGGGGIGMVRNALENPKIPIPSTADIKAAAQAAYQRAEQAGVVVKHDAVTDLGQKIKQAVTDAGIDPTLHPKATAALNRIVNSAGDLSLKQLDILRRVANGAAGSIDKDESRIAHIVLDHIDDFVERLSPGQLVSGSAKVASDAITEARSLWAKQAKSSVIDNILDQAKNRAETVGGSGLENAIRIGFRQLAQNGKRMARFSDDEQAAIKQVARGGPIDNFARLVGKLAPTNLVSILGELGAYAADPKAIALPIAGTIGRGIATAATKRNALMASELVRRGSSAPQQQTFTPEMLSSLLAQRNQRNQSDNMLVPSYAQ